MHCDNPEFEPWLDQYGKLLFDIYVPYTIRIIWFRLRIIIQIERRQHFYITTKIRNRIPSWNLFIPQKRWAHFLQATYQSIVGGCKTLCAKQKRDRNVVGPRGGRSSTPRASSPSKGGGWSSSSRSKSARPRGTSHGGRCGTFVQNQLYIPPYLLLPPPFSKVGKSNRQFCNIVSECLDIPVPVCCRADR